jgi:hypothetical protein
MILPQGCPESLVSGVTTDAVEPVSVRLVAHSYKALDFGGFDGMSVGRRPLPILQRVLTRVPGRRELMCKENPPRHPG